MRTMLKTSDGMVAVGRAAVCILFRTRSHTLLIMVRFPSISARVAFAFSNCFRWNDVNSSRIPPPRRWKSLTTFTVREKS
jgi:hypothetical protein